MTDYIGYGKYEPCREQNYRNGISKKQLKTDIGKLLVEIPRDRDSTFEPILVPKHRRIFTKISASIITLYSKGLSTRNIEETIKDIYGINVSSGTISHITDSVIEDIKD